MQTCVALFMVLFVASSCLQINSIHSKRVNLTKGQLVSENKNPTIRLIEINTSAQDKKLNPRRQYFSSRDKPGSVLEEKSMVSDSFDQNSIVSTKFKTNNNDTSIDGYSTLLVNSTKPPRSFESTKWLAIKNGARLHRRHLIEDGPNNEQCQEKRPAIYGLRCDDGGEVTDGILTIKANEPTKMFLIGHNLDNNFSIALTPTEGTRSADCTHTDRVKSLQIYNISSNIAQVIIDLPSPGKNVPFYLCIRDSREGANWYHQGSEAWLKIFIQQDFLPLYMKIIVIACLLMLSGLFSGLNLGLMALDKNELQVIISCGSETEKRYARAIEPVRRRGNYLLCSILFSNVFVNSTISVLLEELTSGIVAIMTSTIFIVMFGEILPQAFCSRHGLAVGAKTVSITYFCMIVTFPLSYPVSSCLDWALGEEIGHAYDRERLMEFIKVTRNYNNLETDEVNIISGALKLKRIQLSEVMTCIDDVYMLDVNSCLDFETIQSIIEKGYSRIPVHEAGCKKNIIALLFAKDLALLDPDDRTPVKTMISFYKHPIVKLDYDTTLDVALDHFKTGESHMAIVQKIISEGDLDPYFENIGIVTLEDVIEEIIQMEINDETDTLSDNRKKGKRKGTQVKKDFSLFTNLGSGDSSYNVVTPQLCMATYQYLSTTVEPFSSKIISDNILKRLLSQKIYYKVRVDDDQLEKRLYTDGEPADYFIMILEGRVHVVCGKENLVFDGGPFSYFGKAALTSADKTDQLVTATNSLNVPNTLVRKESAVKQEGRRESVVGKALSGQFSISMRKLEQAVNETEMGNTVNSVSGTGIMSNNTPTVQSSKLQPSESRASIHSIASHFIPDYTVEIVANTSYLKITRSEYLAAMKATLVEKGSAQEEESIGELTSSPTPNQSSGQSRAAET